MTIAAAAYLPTAASANLRTCLQCRSASRSAWSVLTRSFPPRMVDEGVAGQGRTEQRSRLLPARLVVYYVMELALFASDGFEEVMRRLVAGLAWTTRWRGTWLVPSSPAISKARTRLGVLPVVAAGGLGRDHVRCPG